MQMRIYYRDNKLDVHEGIMLANDPLEIHKAFQMMKTCDGMA